MMRSFLIYLSQASWARNIVTQWSLARWAAYRFVAGETLEEALQTVKELNAKGIYATLDRLGEHISNPDEARQATDEIIQILDGIEKSDVNSNVSIKLTQIGLDLDLEICKNNLIRILERAEQYKNFIRIDMEGSPWTEVTLGLFRYVKDVCCCDNVGVVIQSYLYRSEKDTIELGKTASRVRLCKGAYKEPHEVAFPKKSDVDSNFDRLTRILMGSALQSGSPNISIDGRIPPLPAIATHDEQRINFAIQYAESIELPRKAFEFQMLHGIRRDLQEELVSNGYPVRVYVPFGTEWYPYYMRRLGERPANLWFFVTNFFRR